MRSQEGDGALPSLAARSNMPTQLSAQERTSFERDGFVVVRSLFEAREMSALARAIDALVARGPRVGEEMFYYEDSLLEQGTRVLSRIERFAGSSTSLARFVQDERITRRAGELLGEPAQLFKEKVNFKLPGGGGFAAHQDIQPGWDDYAPYFVSVLVTVDPSTLENGCLELAAGHHKRGMLGKKWKPLTAAQLVGVVFEPYPMEPGDVAFFDCFVPHQSKSNLTDRQRRNLYLTFNRASDGDRREQYFADKRKSYPPDNEREPGKSYSFKV
jgi:2-aminoethylphosphonate dioxygenase